jgi:hypothetical protein
VLFFSLCGWYSIIMSPLSSIRSWLRLALKYRKDLFALPCGDRCKSTFSLRLSFCTASSNSLRATFVGASSINLGSCFSDVCLVNVLRLTQCWVLFNSLVSCVYHVSFVYVHPLCPVVISMLLTYTQSSLSASVVVVFAAYYFWGAGVLLFLCVLVAAGFVFCSVYVYCVYFGAFCVQICCLLVLFSLFV